MLAPFSEKKKIANYSEIFVERIHGKYAEKSKFDLILDDKKCCLSFVD